MISVGLMRYKVCILVLVDVERIYSGFSKYWVTEVFVSCYLLRMSVNNI